MKSKSSSPKDTTSKEEVVEEVKKTKKINGRKVVGKAKEKEKPPAPVKMDKRAAFGFQGRCVLNPDGAKLG